MCPISLPRQAAAFLQLGIRQLRKDIPIETKWKTGENSKKAPN